MFMTDLLFVVLRSLRPRPSPREAAAGVADARRALPGRAARTRRLALRRPAPVAHLRRLGRRRVAPFGRRHGTLPQIEARGAEPELAADPSVAPQRAVAPPEYSPPHAG